MAARMLQGSRRLQNNTGEGRAGWTHQTGAGTASGAKSSLHERLCPASQRALSTFFTSVQVY